MCEVYIRSFACPSVFDRHRSNNFFRPEIEKRTNVSMVITIKTYGYKTKIQNTNKSYKIFIMKIMKTKIMTLNISVNLKIVMIVVMVS